MSRISLAPSCWPDLLNCQPRCSELVWIFPKEIDRRCQIALIHVHIFIAAYVQNHYEQSGMQDILTSVEQCQESGYNGHNVPG